MLKLVAHLHFLTRKLADLTQTTTQNDFTITFKLFSTILNGIIWHILMRAHQIQIWELLRVARRQHYWINISNVVSRADLPLGDAHNNLFSFFIVLPCEKSQWIS